MNDNQDLVAQLRALRGKVNFVQNGNDKSGKIAVVLPSKLFREVTKP